MLTRMAQTELSTRFDFGICLDFGGGPSEAWIRLEKPNEREHSVDLCQNIDTPTFGLQLGLRTNGTRQDCDPLEHRG